MIEHLREYPYQHSIIGSVNVDPNNGFMAVGSGALNTPSLERSANTLLQYWLYFRSFMLLFNNANARCRFDDESVM